MGGMKSSPMPSTSHEQEAIALARGDQGKPEPGVARGRLDDRAAGLEAAVALGRLDHREPDAVLDRAARVLAFELEEELAGARVEVLHLDERRVADEGEDVGQAGPVIPARKAGSSVSG